MAMAIKMRFLSPLLSLALLYQLGLVLATTFNLVNKCDYTVWPGILSNAGISQLSATGFALQTGASQSVNLPASWGGRLWGRTLCSTDAATGKFACQTGDCGSGKIDCAGGGAATPATLAEFTLDGSGGQDFYDVSLVDGYNLPMMVVPVGGSGANCSATGCAADLNGACPSELRVKSADGSKSVACKSACDAFNQPQYCCSGAYGAPDTCKPSSYSQLFKNACPRAYSYAYDDKTSTFICAGSPDYTITFCPPPSTSQKASASDGQESPAASSSASPILDSSMVYEGAMDVSSAQSWRTWPHVVRSREEMSIGFLAAFWWLWAALLCHRHHFF